MAAEPVAQPEEPTKAGPVASDAPNTPTSVPAAESPGWRADVTAWVWVMGVTGDVGARGFTTSVDASFADVLEASDSVFGFSGRLEVGKGRWGAFLDGVYTNIGVEDQTGPLGVSDVDVTSELVVLDFAAMYRLGEWDQTGDAAASPHRTTLDLYAGGRFTSVDLTLNPEGGAERSRGRSWVDPIVGAKFVLPLSERWHLETSGDVGGFGVSSDFTWSATAVFGYDFTLFDHPASAYAGYRAIGEDYSTGSGSEKFTWDVVMHGPIIGFGIKF